MVFARDKMTEIQQGRTPSQSGSTTYKNPAALHENLVADPYGGQYAFGENAGKEAAAGEGGFLTFDVEGYEGAGQDETFYREEMLAQPKGMLKTVMCVLVCAVRAGGRRGPIQLQLWRQRHRARVERQRHATTGGRWRWRLPRGGRGEGHVDQQLLRPGGGQRRCHCGGQREVHLRDEPKFTRP